MHVHVVARSHALRLARRFQSANELYVVAFVTFARHVCVLAEACSIFGSIFAKRPLLLVIRCLFLLRRELLKERAGFLLAVPFECPRRHLHHKVGVCRERRLVDVRLFVARGDVCPEFPQLARRGDHVFADAGEVQMGCVTSVLEFCEAAGDVFLKGMVEGCVCGWKNVWCKNIWTLWQATCGGGVGCVCVCGGGVDSVSSPGEG